VKKKDFIKRDEHKLQREGKQLPPSKRRSITVDQYVEETINAFRAGAIVVGLDYDFTTVINAFAEYGLRKAMENAEDPLFKEVVSRYANYDELKEHGIVDEWINFQEYKKYKENKRVKTQSA
jgi:hypothetical protein